MVTLYNLCIIDTGGGTFTILSYLSPVDSGDSTICNLLSSVG